MVELDLSYRYLKKNGRIYEDGRREEIIRYSIKIPYFEGDELERINEFYGKIFDNCLNYCSHGGLEGLYSRKKSDHGHSTFIYSFESRVTESNEDMVSVLSSMSLFEKVKSERGEVSKKKLDEFRRGHVFSLPSAMLISPHRLVRMYSGSKSSKKTKYKGKNGVILSNGELELV